MVIFKGNKNYMDIRLTHIRAVFFPRSFQEKYRYLGIIPYKTDSEYFRAIYPLILAMDYEAKPKWCPRWFLRFLHLFGSDNSIIRVRNQKLHNLEKKLTKGIIMWDWKVKWSDYDLRISISAPEHLMELSDAIEEKFYENGYRKDLLQRIKRLEPNIRMVNQDIKYLERRLDEMILEKSKSTSGLTASQHVEER